MAPPDKINNAAQHTTALNGASRKNFLNSFTSCELFPRIEILRIYMDFSSA
jgi:hypothetical protein